MKSMEKKIMIVKITKCWCGFIVISLIGNFYISVHA